MTATENTTTSKKLLTRTHLYLEKQIIYILNYIHGCAVGIINRVSNNVSKSHVEVMMKNNQVGDDNYSTMFAEANRLQWEYSFGRCELLPPVICWPDVLVREKRQTQNVPDKGVLLRVCVIG